jgi:hypothetical protein
MRQSYIINFVLSYPKHPFGETIEDTGNKNEPMVALDSCVACVGGM